MGWFTGNIGYHHIHHLNARIHYLSVAEVLNNIVELQTPKTTSLKSHRNHSLSAFEGWDVESQK